MVPFRGLLHHACNFCDFCVSWLLSLVTRIGERPRVPTRPNDKPAPHGLSATLLSIATEFHCYRSFVEIMILFDVSPPQKQVSFVFRQCMSRCYEVRAFLLAPRITRRERLVLRVWLIDINQKVLADHVALLDGHPIVSDSAESTLFSSQKNKKIRRAARHATRRFDLARWQRSMSLDDGQEESPIEDLERVGHGMAIEKTSSPQIVVH